MKKIIKSLIVANLFLPLSVAYSDAGEFNMDRWYSILNDVQNRAIESGISNHTINSVIQPSVFIPSIVKKDNNQSEFKLTLNQYLKNTVNSGRIQNGFKIRQKYHTLFRAVDKKYGVPNNVILAFWGMESNYGSFKAQYKLSDAFLTLIYDGRRQEFFTKQLFSLMKMADKNKIEIAELQGSWAGAMEHFQFIPTTLEQYGVDGNADRKIDIIHNVSDAMYSAGNYLNKLGWDKSEKILRRIELPENFDYSVCDGKTKKTLNEWREIGINAPAGEMVAGMVCDENERINMKSEIANNSKMSPLFGYLTYPNFYRIKRWNNSNWYAVAIGLLSQELKK